MLNIIEKDGKKYVALTELYLKLELDKTNYQKFIKEQLKQNLYANEGTEFYSLGTKTSEKGGRPKEDFLLTLDFAKDIIIRTKSKVGKQFRDWLISLDKKVTNNQLMSLEKVALAHQMLNTFRFGEYQLEAEDIHKNKFTLTTKTKGNIHKLFYEHRNDLLQIDNEQLKRSLIEAFNNGIIHKATAKNIRSRIALLDRYTLIRNAVADYLLGNGVNTHDALTFADAIKEIAKLSGTEIRIKDEDTLFEQKENLSINQISINANKALN